MRNFFEFLETFSNDAWDGLGSGTFGTGHSPTLPVPTYSPPPETFTTRIRRVGYNQTPIVVEFEDGRVWKITPKQWAYLKAHGRLPQVGAMVDMETASNGMVTGISLRPTPPDATGTRLRPGAVSSGPLRRRHGTRPSRLPPV